MDARELRIGNIIGMNLKEFDQNYFKVLEVAQESMKTGACSMRFDLTGEIGYHDAEYFEGIPITEEWLLKFGFNKRTKSSFSFGYEKEYFIYELNGFLYNQIQANWYANGRILPPVDYVHQLQNLYYALTGTELVLSGSAKV